MTFIGDPKIDWKWMVGDTQVRVMPRASGKTHQILRWLDNDPSDRVVVCISQGEADRLYELARRYGMYGVEKGNFVSVRNLSQLQGKFRPIVGIDNLDLMLSDLFGSNEIGFITMTGDEMNFDTYQMRAKSTAASTEKDNMGLAVYGLGIAGEAGEVADYIKKVIGHGHELDKEKMAKELGDVLWYTAMLADLIGVPLREIAQQNVDKLAKRYPNGFEHERSINRDE